MSTLLPSRSTLWLEHHHAQNLSSLCGLYWEVLEPKTPFRHHSKSPRPSDGLWAMRKVPLLVVETVQIQLLACVGLETKPSQSYRELCMCDAVGGPAGSFCDTQYLTCYKWCPLDWWSLSTWLDWEITWELLFWEDQGGCFHPQSGFTEEEGEWVSDWINMKKGERKLSTRFPFPSLVSNPSRGE